MGDNTKCISVVMEDNTSPIKYCFGCLSDSHEKQIQKYTFICETLKKILQMQNIYLCCYCKRMAQHTESFINNIQFCQTLLENLCIVNCSKNNNVKEDNNIIKSLRSQTQPLVKLTTVSLQVIELSEKVGDTCEEFGDGLGLELKTKVKEEEESMDNIEEEFVNDDDETYTKEEDDNPLNVIVKEELDIGNTDINISSTLEKHVTKEDRITREETTESIKGIPILKPINITRKQCIEERAKMSADPKYLDSAYKCVDCIKGFTFKGSYDKHMEKHNQCSGAFECDICKQRMESEEKLDKHMRYHLVINNKKKRQQRYREQNREKLKQREAERRKRIQYLQSVTETSSSLNINRIELNNKEMSSTSQSLSSSEGTKLSSIQRKEKAEEKKALQRRAHLQRYREQNREKFEENVYIYKVLQNLLRDRSPRLTIAYDLDPVVATTKQIQGVI